MITRRRLIQNAAAITVLGADSALAQQSQPTILKLRRQTLEINRKPASVYEIAQPNGQHGITFDYGVPFHVRVENELSEPSLIHWHGLTPPSDQDGVPGISGPVIPVGGAATYLFDQTFGGTYWMHSHYELQEQRLLAAPLIIRYPKKYTEYQDIVVMLADFSFTSPQEIYASLTKNRSITSSAIKSNIAAPGAEAMTHDNMTMMHSDQIISTGHGGDGGIENHVMPAAPETGHAHHMADLNDVSYDAFLANNRTLSDPQITNISNDGRVLLRVINGATMSNFHVDLGEIDGILISVDGQEILPVKGRMFPIAAGQRLDILMSVPSKGIAYPVFFNLEGDRRRSGIIMARQGDRVTKYSDVAEDVAPPVDLTLEHILQAAWPLAPRRADRVYSLDLTGDMQNYIWSINNIAWKPSTPALPLRKGERVELAMLNRTMMAHPMHLHGHRFQVVEIDNRRFSGALRDTIHIPPGKRVVVAFDADNPGVWAFHCHLAYHMHAGMFTTFQYI